jgi:hypothetical protein
MPDRSRKSRPRDPNQLAKLMIDIATGQVEDEADSCRLDAGKDPAAVSLGRRGGLKGGRRVPKNSLQNKGLRLPERQR